MKLWPRMKGRQCRGGFGQGSNWSPWLITFFTRPSLGTQRFGCWPTAGPPTLQIGLLPANKPHNCSQCGPDNASLMNVRQSWLRRRAACRTGMGGTRVFLATTQHIVGCICVCVFEFVFCVTEKYTLQFIFSRIIRL